VIIETSALIAVLRAEAGSDVLKKAMYESETELRLSAASLLEAAIVTDASRDPVLSRELDDLVDALGIIIEPVTEHQARIAREAYRDYGKGSGHPARLNFGDCFAYALARDRGEPLLYKGSDFAHTDIRSALS
jgi:ribonuclease VapC